MILGHYDSCYEAQAEEQADRNKKLAKNQLKLMKSFMRSMYDLSWEGVSERHREQFRDMMNDAVVRASGKQVE